MPNGARFMPTEPTGRFRSLIDLMEQIDRGQFEEAQVAGARRRRLWDVAMPGIERLGELSRATLEGRFRETPVGRAAEAGVMRQTAGLRSRIRDLMARRGVTGQPIEAAAMGRAELAGGEALQQIPISEIGRAEQVAGGVLPSLTQLTRPEFPRVQTGALQYLGQVMPYNLSLEGLYSRFAEQLGRGRGEEEIYRRPPTTGIEELFNVLRPRTAVTGAGTPAAAGGGAI